MGEYATRAINYFEYAPLPLASGGVGVSGRQRIILSGRLSCCDADINVDQAPWGALADEWGGVGVVDWSVSIEVPGFG